MDTVTNKDLLLERFAEHPGLLGELAAIFQEDGPMRLATQAVDAAHKLELMGHDGNLTGVDQALAHLQLIVGKLNLELGALAVGTSR